MSDTNIRLRRSGVAGKVPTTAQLDLGELAINTYDGNIYLKINQAGAEEILKFSATVPVENVYYVQKAGSDTNDGQTWDTAFATIERAIEVVTPRGELTVIHIGPGVYTTQGHIDVPDDTIIHSDYRAAVFRPETGFEQRNVFRLGSGCFLQGPLFEGFQVDDIDNPTEGFAVSFRPGAVIRRTPYAHKIAVRSIVDFTVAPPLDRNNANPFVPRGGGVCLADGLVCSPYSIYPNFMTWGATPVSQNGIGYVAKNGALINAVNAISIWAHKHFMALDGGQIILSACSTQFGDYTLVSKGKRLIVQPEEPTVADTLTVQSTAGLAIMDSDFLAGLKNDVWDELVTQGYYLAGDSAEVFTKRDTGTIVQSISWVLQSANLKPWTDTVKGFFDTQGNSVIDAGDSAGFIYAWNYIDSALRANASVNDSADTIISSLFTSLTNTINSPVKLAEPSIITAIGHTWNSIMAGVALTKIPPARNLATIEDSILELDEGIVIASGQDDQGTALFIGGMKIDADTGELTGPPFESAVNRIANRSAIARSF